VEQLELAELHRIQKEKGRVSHQNNVTVTKGNPLRRTICLGGGDKKTSVEVGGGECGRERRLYHILQAGGSSQKRLTNYFGGA